MWSPLEGRPDEGARDPHIKARSHGPVARAEPASTHRPGTLPRPAGALGYPMTEVGPAGQSGEAVTLKRDTTT